MTDFAGDSTGDACVFIKIEAELMPFTCVMFVLHVRHVLSVKVVTKENKVGMTLGS